MSLRLLREPVYKGILEGNYLRTVLKLMLRLTINVQGGNMKRFKRVFVVVIDSLGIGAMDNAAEYGDEGSDTLGHIDATVIILICLI